MKCTINLSRWYELQYNTQTQYIITTTTIPAQRVRLSRVTPAARRNSSTVVGLIQLQGGGGGGGGGCGGGGGGGPNDGPVYSGQGWPVAS